MQVCKTRTCVWTCNGRPNGFASRLASSCKSQKVVNFKHKKFTCNKLVFTCVGWPNAENRALNCTWIWTQPKSTQVIASQGTRLVTKLNASQKVVFTCESVCPGLYDQYQTHFSFRGFHHKKSTEKCTKNLHKPLSKPMLCCFLSTEASYIIFWGQVVLD